MQPQRNSISIPHEIHLPRRLKPWIPYIQATACGTGRSTTFLWIQPISTAVARYGELLLSFAWRIVMFGRDEQPLSARDHVSHPSPCGSRVSLHSGGEGDAKRPTSRAR